MSAIEQFTTEVIDSVNKALNEMGASDIAFQTEVPPTDAADLAVPCFQMSKALRKAPAMIAEEIASRIQVGGTIVSVTPVNGYLNFKMDDSMLVEGTVRDILNSDGKYGAWPKKGIRVNVEHTSTNPTGPIHVGRARNPVIGDTLARALAMCGYDVSTEYYVNDVGKQVVILTWGVNNLTEEQADEERERWAKEHEKEGQVEDRDKTDHKWVAFYRIANRMMENDPAVKEEISDMLRRFEAGDQEIIDTVRKTAEGMLDGLRQTLGNIGVTLDTYTWESRFIADGSARDVVERIKQCDKAGQEENGAWFVDLKDYGIHGKNTKFTFTRADGTTLYTTRDIAYHLDKFKRADRLIDVLGEDQKLGSKQLCCVLDILGSERMPEPMFYSFVSLPEGKMSTRRGVVVYLDDLIDEAVARAYDEIKQRRTDIPEEKMREIANAVGVGAIRYNIVRVQPEKQFVFTWSDALNFDGNSGPFVQYAHARACSMLKKAGEYQQVVDASKLTDAAEIKLVKVLSKLPEVIRSAAEDRRIHLLPAYAHEVASAFNQFYAAVPVLTSGESRDARITLVDCTRIVLRNVLNTMGLAAPEEM
ncbi:MAG: arginine--tRNA ligase [Candidatus Methanomethylophilaceae archaeon]|nr:arginine--tRNA ligase [Candidatus Methanomethylophilaceae archaeon]